jgi:hypothetical protein
MPLPYLNDTNRCTAKCKARQSRCFNLAAYGMRVCKVHGARKKETILKGKDHPRYKHGNATQKARADYSEAALRLRELEQMMVDIGMVGAKFKRTVGRKPKVPI